MRRSRALLRHLSANALDTILLMDSSARRDVVRSLLVQSGLPDAARDLQKAEQLKGGTTNTVLLCKTQGNQSTFLVRIFGRGTEVLIDRKREALCFKAVSERGLGPKLLGEFPNGRVEEYIPSRPLRPAEMRERQVSLAIARRMKDLHTAIKEDDLPPGALQHHARSKGAITGDAQLLATVAQLRGWAEMAVKQDATQGLAGWDALRLRRKVESLEDRLNRVASPRCLCHNDMNHLNILLRHPSNHQQSRSSGAEAPTVATAFTGDDAALVLVDWEYASWNARGFDVGNHLLCEWAGDLASDTPHRMDWSHCPSVEQQQAFCREYLAYPNRRPEDVPAEEVSGLMREAFEWSLASHLFWGMWALLQSRISTLDFDYIAYGELRLRRYQQVIAEGPPV